MKANLIFLFLLVCLFSCGQLFDKPDYSLNKANNAIYEFTSSRGTKIYLKQTTRGLTGDNRKIFISSNNVFDNNYDSDSDLVFYDYDSFFYCFKTDTLTLITMKKFEGNYKLPNGFVIIQKEIDNLEFQNSWNGDKYKEKGFEKIIDTACSAINN